MSRPFFVLFALVLDADQLAFLHLDRDTGYGGWKERHGGRDHKDRDVPDKDLDRRKEG